MPRILIFPEVGLNAPPLPPVNVFKVPPDPEDINTHVLGFAEDLYHKA